MATKIDETLSMVNQLQPQSTPFPLIPVAPSPAFDAPPPVNINQPPPGPSHGPR